MPSWLTDPLRDQFAALLPERGRFDPAHPRSATTTRTRRDEWIAAGVFEAIELIVLECYDRIIGLQLSYLPADGCPTKAPSGGQRSGPSPVDLRTLGLK